MRRAILDFVSQHPRLALVLVGLYLLSPIDLLPEAFMGPLGYIDDLVLLVLTLVPSLLKRRSNGPEKR